MKQEQISSTEQVVRLLNRIWIVEGELQPAAFVLNVGETYLSVNRPAVDSYESDVDDFISKHPAFCVRSSQKMYYRANLSVFPLPPSLMAQFAFSEHSHDSA